MQPIHVSNIDNLLNRQYGREYSVSPAKSPHTTSYYYIGIMLEYMYEDPAQQVARGRLVRMSPQNLAVLSRFADYVPRVVVYLCRLFFIS